MVWTVELQEPNSLTRYTSTSLTHTALYRMHMAVYAEAHYDRHEHTATDC